MRRAIHLAPSRLGEKMCSSTDTKEIKLRKAPALPEGELTVLVMKNSKVIELKALRETSRPVTDIATKKRRSNSEV